jgi:hypothetical protein
MRGSVIALLAGCLGLGACDDGPSAVEGPIMVSPCNGLLSMERMTSQEHVPQGSPIDFTHNPPDSGPHYPIWAQWDEQYTALQRGNYVHNAEHGGIVLLYHCDPDASACPDVLASLVDVARNMEPDPTCVAPITKRVIIASDPLMPDVCRLRRSRGTSPTPPAATTRTSPSSPSSTIATVPRTPAARARASAERPSSRSDSRAIVRTACKRADSSCCPPRR